MLAKIFKARHDCILNRFCCCENLSAVKSFTSKASTVKSKVKKWRKIFSQSNIAEPDASAEYIVSHVLGKKTINCLNARQNLTEKEDLKIDFLCQKRLSYVPIQYVIEEWDFFDLTLKMQQPVFIPRSETHGLVDAVIQEINCTSVPHFNLLEVGCGSGAISLALLKAHSHKTISKPFKLTALDLDENAVNLTKQNAAKTGFTKFSLLHCDIKSFSTTHQFHGIVSNPPYIPSKDIPSLQSEILSFESKLALDGGEDGLDVINEIVDRASTLLSVNGWIWLEVDTQHPKIMKKLYKNFDLTEVKKDLFGRDRFVKLVKLS